MDILESSWGVISPMLSSPRSREWLRAQMLERLLSSSADTEDTSAQEREQSWIKEGRMKNQDGD